MGQLLDSIRRIRIWSAISYSIINQITVSISIQFCHLSIRSAYVSKSVYSFCVLEAA